MPVTLLKIMKLLNERRPVSREALAKRCGVSIATVTETIDYAARAGIPVSFDETNRTYCLGESGRGTDDQISSFDVIVLRLAVQLLKKRLNGLYRPTVEQIENRLNSLSSWGARVRVESLLQTLERRPDPAQLLRDLNCCLILEAIRLGREIKVMQSDDSGQTHETVVSKASLEFGREWILRDLEGTCDQQIPISSVTAVRLV